MATDPLAALRGTAVPVTATTSTSARKQVAAKQQQAAKRQSRLKMWRAAHPDAAPYRPIS